MRLIASILFILILNSYVFATNQVKDILIYGNDTMYFYESPLEFAPGISVENIGKEIYGEDYYVSSSDCWRGFKAEWEISDSCLFLVNVFDCDRGNNINQVIEKLTGKKFENGLLRADWLNSAFWCGSESVGGIYITIYKHEYFFKFNEGKLVGVEECHYKPCHLETEDEILSYIFNKIDWENAPSIYDKTYITSVYIEPDESGKVDRIKFENGYNEFTPILRQILLSLPCLNVYFNEGEFWDIGETLYIRIDEKNKAKYVR